MFLLALYTAGMNIYIYCTFYTEINIVTLRIIYQYMAGLTLSWCIIDEAFGYVSKLNKKTNHLCKISLLINIFLIILSLNNKLHNPIAYFLCLNISITVLTVMILISGGRHGFFRK